MKNGEIYGVNRVLSEVLKSARSAKLIYGMTKNLERTEREIRIFDVIRRPSGQFNEFTSKRVALCEASSRRDEKGVIKTVPGPNGTEYDIIDRPAFDKALELLRQEYAGAIDEYNAAIGRFNKHMDDESELKIYKVKYSVFEKEQAELEVKDRLDGVQTRQIWFMIEDDMEQAEMPVEKSELKMVQ